MKKKIGRDRRKAWEKRRGRGDWERRRGGKRKLWEIKKMHEKEYDENHVKKFKEESGE